MRRFHAFQVQNQAKLKTIPFRNPYIVGKAIKKWKGIIKAKFRMVNQGKQE